MAKDKKLHIEFAPGAFDNFDGTQEELDALLAELQRLADSGELEEMSVDITDDEAWDSLSDEEKEIIESALTGGQQRRLQ